MKELEGLTIKDMAGEERTVLSLERLLERAGESSVLGLNGPAGMRLGSERPTRKIESSDEELLD